MESISIYPLNTIWYVSKTVSRRVARTSRVIKDIKHICGRVQSLVVKQNPAYQCKIRKELPLIVFYFCRRSDRCRGGIYSTLRGFLNRCWSTAFMTAVII